MEITTIGSMLVDVFELEAVVGLALLAIVIVTLVRSLLVEHRRNGHPPDHRSDR